MISSIDPTIRWLIDRKLHTKNLVTCHKSKCSLSYKVYAAYMLVILDLKEECDQINENKRIRNASFVVHEVKSIKNHIVSTAKNEIPKPFIFFISATLLAVTLPSLINKIKSHQSTSLAVFIYATFFFLISCTCLISAFKLGRILKKLIENISKYFKLLKNLPGGDIETFKILQQKTFYTIDKMNDKFRLSPFIENLSDPNLTLEQWIKNMLKKHGKELNAHEKKMMLETYLLIKDLTNKIFILYIKLTNKDLDLF